jgi:DNA-binding PadR family transcriptional regulator
MFRHFKHPPSAGPEDPFARGCHGRHHARFGGRHEHFDRAFGGGGRERLFDAGDLQLIILELLAQKPSYGYELIKAIEERMSGGYAPSPGVVYPTLTLLEERGLARIESTEGARKVYAVTDEGRAELSAHAERLREISDRMTHSGGPFRSGRSPHIRRAFGDLRRAVLLCAVRGRDSGKGLSDTQIAKIIAAIEGAARSIDTI